MNLRFRPDIEGLRAVAIVPVVLFHAFPTIMPGGFVGVDVFFVISGFLITSVLMGRLDAGQYTLASFYGARIRRIFPALFVMLAIVTPLAAWLLSPAQLSSYQRTLAATAVFFSNMELHGSSGYFAASTDLKPLVHTWSLAVEEQYYILFPIVLAVLFRSWKRGIPVVLMAVGLVSLALSIWWVHKSPNLAFYSAVSRTFELMIGSMLAVGSSRFAPSRFALEALGILGLVMIGMACAAFSAQTPFPGAAALVPCLGAAALIWTGGRANTWASRLLSLAPVRWVGAMSFSLYLWHWPALVFARHLALGELRPWQAATAVGAAVLLAWLSLRLVEAPWRRAPFTDRRLIALGVACIASTLGAALMVSKVLPGPDATGQGFLAAAEDFNPHRPRCHGQTRNIIPYQEHCRFGNDTVPPMVSVWADSHGAELALALGEVAGRNGLSVTQITASACPPSVGMSFKNRPNCLEHNLATLKGLVADVSIRQVVMIAFYKTWLSDEPEAFEAGLRRSIEALIAAGKSVVLVEPIPSYTYPVPDALYALYRRGQPVETFGQSVDDYMADQAQALAMLQRLGKIPGVKLLRTRDHVCPNGSCLVLTRDGQPFYFDAHHLSVFGARHLVFGASSEMLPLPQSGDLADLATAKR